MAFISSVFQPPPPAPPHVCGTQKGKCVPQGGGIFSIPQMALNQLHITKPPCRAPGPGYSCWDKFIHGCMGSCLIEAHYFHFLLTPRTPRGAAQASARGRGWNSCCCSHGSRRGWGITVPSPSTAASLLGTACEEEQAANLSPWDRAMHLPRPPQGLWHGGGCTPDKLPPAGASLHPPGISGNLHVLPFFKEGSCLEEPPLNLLKRSISLF